MPVTIQKKKVVKKAPIVPKNTTKMVKGENENVQELAQDTALPDFANMSLEDLADQYGSLEDRCNAIKVAPVFMHFKLAQEELKKRLDEELEDPEDTAELQGAQWYIDISACSKKPRRVSDIMKVMEFTGPECFARLISIKLGDLDKHLTPAELDQVIDDSTEFTKTRKITAKYIGG